jgi:hypothetical protein
MVRAPSGHTPREQLIMTRMSRKRKYNPGVESLERRRLLSGGLQAHAVMALVQATPVMLSSPQITGIHPCGTGTGTIIITEGWHPSQTGTSPS